VCLILFPICSEKLSAVAECSRLRANITSQQELHKGCLIQYDKELYDLRREVICSKECIDRIQSENVQMNAVKVHLQEELSSSKLRLHSFSSQLCDAENALKVMETENIRLISQLQDLDEKERSQRTAVMISESESGMLKDKATLAVLTSEALESEIKMLRRDIQDRDDNINERDFTVMSLTSQLNSLQDTLLQAKQDLEDSANSSKALTLRNESIISDLKSDMESLRNQHSDELAVLYTELNLSQSNYGQLQRQMADVKAQYDFIQRSCLEKDAVIEQLNGNLISANEKMSSALAQIKSLHERINALEQQSSDMELTIQLKDSELHAIQARNQCVEMTLNQVKADMSRLVIECDRQLGQKEVEAAKQVAAVQDKYDEQEKEFFAALRLAEDTQDNLRSDLQRKLDEMTEMYEQQIKKTQEVSERTLEQSNHHQRMLQSKEEELSRMNHQVQLKENDMNSRNIQIAQLESKIVEMNLKVSSQTSEVQSMKSSSMELLEKLRSRELESDSLKDNLMSMEASYLEREKSQAEEATDLRVRHPHPTYCTLALSSLTCLFIESTAHCFLPTASIPEQVQLIGRKTRQGDVCSPTDTSGIASIKELSEGRKR